MRVKDNRDLSVMEEFHLARIESLQAKVAEQQETINILTQTLIQLSRQEVA